MVLAMPMAIIRTCKFLTFDVHGLYRNVFVSTLCSQNCREILSIFIKLPFFWGITVEIPAHVAFRPGNHGRSVTNDLHPRCESLAIIMLCANHPYDYFEKLLGQ